jgi:hypothetical protein
MKCPCCQGTGKIDEIPESLLSPMQLKIYQSIRDSSKGIGGEELIRILYGHRYDGGPDWPWDSIHVTIYNMNKRLAIVGQRVCSNRRGAGAIYRIKQSDVV